MTAGPKLGTSATSRRSSPGSPCRATTNGHKAAPELLELIPPKGTPIAGDAASTQPERAIRIVGGRDATGQAEGLAAHGRRSTASTSLGRHRPAFLPDDPGGP